MSLIGSLNNAPISASSPGWLPTPPPWPLARLLPRPGPLWGDYPLRADTLDAPTPGGGDGPAKPPWRSTAWQDLCQRPMARATFVAAQARPAARAWLALAPAQRQPALLDLRRQLRRDGLTPANMARALGVACAAARLSLRQNPRHNQRLAAALLLDQRLAEMATGEGKTLALALAASVAALAGMPVHLVTANDYLAERDAQQLAPLYHALGLSVAALPPRQPPAPKSGGMKVASAAQPPSAAPPPDPVADDDARHRAAYGHDVLYATARELAFDFLRDQLSLGAGSASQRLAASVAHDLAHPQAHDTADATAPSAAPAPPPPLMRGLCLALVDELDSILLDEAEVPLVLSQAAPHAARRAFMWQALALARQLAPGSDFELQPEARSARLTALGQAHAEQLAAGLGGPWRRARYRQEALNTALAALHACQRDVHYLVRDGAIVLLDEVTGRVAEGRVWSRGLHTVVALKEGLAAPDETDTLAQTSFQRFFQRYWRVAGLSGTLLEGRVELQRLLGTTVHQVPTNAPLQRRLWPTQVFETPAQRWDAVAEHVASLRAAGRPVLIGTDSVADSLAAARALTARGVPHLVLNALQDAQEAAIVARAGRAGQVTVATRMAGRGTDIRLDRAARAAGGLHVLSCQHNPSRRLDRQLAGRAGRQGEPGSAETWLLARTFDDHDDPAPPKLAAWIPIITLTWRAHRVRAQWRQNQNSEERRRADLRRMLLQQEAQWAQRLAFAGPPR